MNHTKFIDPNQYFILKYNITKYYALILKFHAWNNLKQYMNHFLIKKIINTNTLYYKEKLSFKILNMVLYGNIIFHIIKESNKCILEIS